MKKKIVKKKRNMREVAKECAFCKEKRNPDFLDVETLRKFISERGFSIHAEKTDWIHSASPPDNPNIAALYRSKTTHKGVQAGLTIRVDDLQIKQSLKNYVKQWLKDYPRFGFDILNSKPIRINNG
jgi:hypothetical protein